MSTLKISYNGSEISSVDVTTPMPVTYNNSTIATLNDGDIKTLCCDGKVMETDVVIGSKTLNCSGKLMQGDIVVELLGSAPSREVWYFNETPVYTYTFTVENGVTVNGNHYSWFMVWSSFTQGKPTITCYPEAYPSNNGALNIYMSKKGGWQNDAYRTVTFDNPVTGDFLVWLKSNATELA